MGHSILEVIGALVLGLLVGIAFGFLFRGLR